MIALFIAPFFILLNIYLAHHLLMWLRTLHSLLKHPVIVGILITLYVLLTLSPLAAAFGHGKLQVYGHAVFNHWLGVLLYFAGLMLIAELATFIYRLIKKQPVKPHISEPARRIRGLIIFVCVLCLTTYGTIHAYDVKKTSYQVTIDKTSSRDSMKIALVADLHLGSNVGTAHIQKMKDIIDDMHPDLIVYAGDIFDNDYDLIDNPDRISAILKDLSSTYGSYACWGNHDLEEVILAGFTFHSKDKSITSDPRMDQFLKDSGITLLKDESVLIDDSFYLAGRLDASSNKKAKVPRSTPEELLAPLDHAKPILVIDHQPAELAELAAAGSDLTLSGHTHNGQNAPGNLALKLKWDNPCGMIKVGNMTDIVTSGLGMWGPAMRVGTDSEVVEINVTFK